MAIVAGGNALGIAVSGEMACQFTAMFLAARPAYEAASRTRDAGDLRRFWVDLHADWLAGNGLAPRRAEELVTATEAFVEGWFRPFPDAIRCLESLKAEGIRLAVLSNWDSSLARILEMQRLRPYFEVVVASLEEGLEKPAPELFLHMADRLGVQPGDIIHVGDDPLDDIEGAHAAGMRALWLDRTGGEARPGRISTLDALPAALESAV